MLIYKLRIVFAAFACLESHRKVDLHFDQNVIKIVILKIFI